MVKVGDKVQIGTEGLATVVRLMGKGRKAAVIFDEDGPEGRPVERWIEEEEVK